MNTANPIGTLILLGVLLFIVYRVLQAINKGHISGEESAGGDVIQIHRREAVKLPPPRITLEPKPDENGPFAKKEGTEEIHETLTDRAGMLFIGDFTINEMPGYRIRAYTHPEFSMVGVVYLNPDKKMWVNLTTKYKDGRVITSSSAEEGVIAGPRPRGMPLFNFPNLPIDQLLRRHKLEIRAADKEEPVGPEKFPEYFAENYARLVEGVMEEKKEEMEASRTGSITPLPMGEGRPEEEEKLFLPSPGQLREWLEKIYASYPVPREKRRQFQKGLVWVSEDADMGSISQTISRYAGVDMNEVEKGRWVIRTESGAEDIVEEGNLKGPALFEKINACLPAGKRFTRLPVSLEGVAFYNRMAME